MVDRILENYSDELQYTARVCHQLHVNIEHLFYQFEYTDDDSFRDNEICYAQLKHMKSLLNLSGERFVELLKKETSISGLVFKETYPFVQEYPNWISDLFPYYRSKEEDENIIKSGGSVINFDGPIESNSTVVESNVPDSFIVVWYPIAAGYAEPGFTWKVDDKRWLAHSLEI